MLALFKTKQKELKSFHTNGRRAPVRVEGPKGILLQGQT